MDKCFDIYIFLFCITRDVISKGGNAVDAIIAVMLCDGALCPEYMGLSGGFLMSLYNSTSKKVTAINARESASSAAYTNMFVNDSISSVYGTYIIVKLNLQNKYIYNIFGYISIFLL